MQIQVPSIFEKNWQIYQKIIANNYMLHKDIAEYTSKYLNQISNESAINMLDLGCGDAKQIANQLGGLNIKSYTGIDMSDAALQFAQKNIELINCAGTFLTGPMEVLIKKNTSIYNVIYSSYAIHHLSDAGKKEFLLECRNRLSKNGVFILIDIFRQPMQSMAEYKNEYCTWIKNYWNSLDPEEMQMIFDHINEYDFPNEIENMISYATAVGLKVTSYSNFDKRHGAIIFSL
jgi:2-polyprenyl-3-methyl-5-hydroxy-6-metoxy-1,4-benzoquinol methylase